MITIFKYLGDEIVFEHETPEEITPQVIKDMKKQFAHRNITSHPSWDDYIHEVNNYWGAKLPLGEAGILKGQPQPKWETSFDESKLEIVTG